MSVGYSHGKKWDEKQIADAILLIVRENHMNTFPTHSEMEQFYGNKALSVRVSRTGGTRYWASKLNLRIKQCESEFGNEYELRAIQDIFENTGLTAIQTKPRYPYDLFVDGQIKVDVKASKQIFTNCHTWQNTFHLEKVKPTCDIFVLYCLDKDGIFIKRLIIPSCILSGKTQIGVGKESKWNEYEDNWNLFREYHEFYQKLLKAGDTP